MLDVLGDVDQFEPDAQVGFVRTVAAHRFFVGHARERIVELHVDDFLEDVTDHAFDRVLHVALGDEGEFHVELREFGLAVGAQVFVAEAARDLIVAIHAGHHQQLLEQLRRLRQRVELAGMHAARHEIVARAFRRGLGEDRRFDVLESARIEIVAQRGDELGAHAQLALHVGAADVEIAIAQARVFAGGVVEHERQRRGGVEHFDGRRDDFDLARLQTIVDLARRTIAHLAGDAQAEFIAHVFGGGERGLVVGLDDDLHDAFVVAQIDEDDAAVIAPRVGPAAQGDFAIDEGLVDEAAEMGTHTWSVRGKARVNRTCYEGFCCTANKNTRRSGCFREVTIDYQRRSMVKVPLQP